MCGGVPYTITGGTSFFSMFLCSNLDADNDHKKYGPAYISTPPSTNSRSSSRENSRENSRDNPSTPPADGESASI